MILKGYIFSILYGLVCLALGFIAYKLGMEKKYSRKLVHILVGFEWVILYHFMGASYHFLIVCLLYTALLLVSHIKNLMPMISSELDNSPGTVYYGVAMSIMAFICLFIPEMVLPFGVGVFCTSFGDGFAGVVGQLVKKRNPVILGSKTLFGMLANFVFSTAVAIILSHFYSMGLAIWQCIVIGVLAVGIEAIATRGLDNVLITLFIAFLTYAFMYSDTINNYIVPIILTPLVIGAVLEKKVLTHYGLVLALVLDLVVSLTLGNFGFTLLVVFLFGSVLIDKIKKRKKLSDSVINRGECRDAVQVIANGLMPLIMALLFSSTMKTVFLVGYVAALAEAFADTASSGLGVYSKSTFDIFKLRRCKKGLSGGMSLIGTVAALVASLIISLIAYAFGAIDARLLFVTTGAAFLGSVFDSFLGSVFQIKYRCTECSEIIEREVHCDKPTVRYSGFAFFDNDVVNLFSGVFASVLAILLSMIVL